MYNKKFKRYNKLFDVGVYKTGLKYNSKSIQYKYWFSLLDRCYNKQRKHTHRYKDCIVCEEWFTFSNFYQWFDENYYEVDGHKMNLDKDLLFKDNKIYSPETCVFLPHKINCLFNRSQSQRGDLPIGVYYEKGKDRYRCSLMINDKRVKGARYKDFNKAFLEYKRRKEAYIKQVAEEFKGYIPENAYNAMINWKVEITD